MHDRKDLHPDAVLQADAASLSRLLSSSNDEILRALIENPALEELHILLLLKRADLPGTLLEEIAKKKAWRDCYRVRLALASHPRMPRLTAAKLLRDIHLTDLLRISTLPTATAELRRMAEERILAQLPQLPLGQRLVLARRGSGRVAAGVLAAGPVTAVKPALDNPLLTEAQLLKTLAESTASALAIAAVAQHLKWSRLVNIRVALVRNPHTPINCVLAFLPDLPRRDIEALLEFPRLPVTVREFLRQELIRRDSR